MITEHTLFITGAGASCPYNYPTGKDLRIKICKEFPSKYLPILAQKHGRTSPSQGEVSSINKFAKIFEKSTTPSIDLFLSRHAPIFDNIGKIAIAYFILKAEHESVFHHNVKNQNEDWYSYLFERMSKELIKPDDYAKFGENDINFITFNYDRSLEFFLYESFIHSWFNDEREFLEKANITNSKLLEKIKDLDDKEKETKFKRYIPFKFIHMYGKICDVGSEIGKRYPYDIDYSNLNSFSNNIKIVYEKNDINDENLFDLIKSSKRIFFLGFGFAPENLQAIKVPEILTIEHQIFGTVKGFTKKQIQDLKNIFFAKSNIKDEIERKVFYENLHFEDIGCRELIEKYL